MPKPMATTMASTEASTLVAPFMPQSHGVSSRLREFRAAARMPMGKGMPMSRPMGASSPMAVRIRRGVDAP